MAPTTGFVSPGHHEREAHLQSTQQGPAAPADTCDFIALYKWLGNGSNNSMLSCLLMTLFYLQYRQLPLQQRRRNPALANSLRALAFQFGISNVNAVSDAIRWLESQHMLTYDSHKGERNAPLIEAQTLGDVTLTREGTELCRKLLREHGPHHVPVRTEAQVAMRLSGFYLTTLIERGIRNRAELAQAMHFNERRLGDMLIRLAARGIVWINLTGAVVGLLAFEHDHHGFYDRLRERFDAESAAWVVRCNGVERAKQAIQAKLAKMRSRVARARYVQRLRDSEYSSNLIGAVDRVLASRRALRRPDASRGTAEPAATGCSGPCDPSSSRTSLDDYVKRLAEGNMSIPRPPMPEDIFDELSDTYTAEGCQIWWESRNKTLDGWRPWQLWGMGENGRQRVREAIDRIGGGPRV